MHATTHTQATPTSGRKDTTMSTYTLEQTQDGWILDWPGAPEKETYSSRAKARARVAELRDSGWLNEPTETPTINEVLGQPLVTELVPGDGEATPPTTKQPRVRPEPKPVAATTPKTSHPRVQVPEGFKRCAGVSKYGIASHDVPLAEAQERFAKDKSKKDGLDVICKTCMTLYGQARKAEKAGLTPSVLAATTPTPTPEPVAVDVTCPHDGKAWSEHSAAELRQCRNRSKSAAAQAAAGDRRSK